MINVDEIFEKRYGGKTARQYFEENEYFTPIEMINFAKHCVDQSCASGGDDTVAEGWAVYRIVIEGNKQTIYKNGDLIDPMSDEAKMFTQLHTKARKSSEGQP